MRLSVDGRDLTGCLQAPGGTLWRYTSYFGHSDYSDLLPEENAADLGVIIYAGLYWRGTVLIRENPNLKKAPTLKKRIDGFSNL